MAICYTAVENYISVTIRRWELLGAVLRTEYQSSILSDLWIFACLVGVHPLFFPLFPMYDLLYTALSHSTTLVLIHSFHKQLRVPYSVHTQYGLMGTQNWVVHVPWPPGDPVWSRKHSVVFLGPLKTPPNITHMWFRPQDLSETRFSTLLHPQTINSALCTTDFAQIRRRDQKQYYITC